MFRLPAQPFSRRLLAAFIAAATLFVLPPTAAAAQDGSASAETTYEERDRISAAAIEFSGEATSANAKWLVHLYEEAFDRPADVAGLDHWLARIAAGGEESRSVVARAFLNSVEGSTLEANRAYNELLARAPDPLGLEFWTDFLRTGSVNTLRFQHLASDEYFENAGDTNESYVDQLYFDLLGREIDPQGFSFYVDLLETGTPRWWVSRTIYESPESLGNRVTAYHEEILGRSPTTEEIEVGVIQILNDDERAVRAALLASDEAFEEFLQAALNP